MKKVLFFSLAGLVAVIGAVPAAQSPAPAQAPSTVRVDSGELQGVAADGVLTFRGVPFAAPPVGELRWRPPQPLARWTGVRPATTNAPNCMQGGFGGGGRGPGAPAAGARAGAPGAPPAQGAAPAAAPGAPPAGARAAGAPAGPAAPAPSEDCLYLNVWRPADQAARDLPVMVWIYGGGFTGGSISSPNTSGHEFAKQGVVLVAMNYRLGRFGFFAHPALSSERPNENKGNYAYMDQIAALQWVRQNIAAFGGNPNNVTIFGFSAGGVSVHSLLTSPQARGLFHKAIVHSGGSRDSVLTPRPMRADGVDPNYPVSAETIGTQFARSMGIEGTDQGALSKLRGLTAEEVQRGAAPQPGVTVRNYETTPILDGRLITETAETAYKARRAPRVPLMLGSNSADTAGNRVRATTKEELWARFGQWSAEARAAYDPSGTAELSTLIRDANDDFGQAEPARFAANAFAANGSPVYLYMFSYVPTAQRQPGRGSPHGGDVSFAFGTLGSGRGGAPTPEDLAVSRIAQGYWVNFARTGDPNGPGLPTWPRHVAGNGQIFDFRSDGTAGAGPDPRKARLDVTEKATDAGARDDNN
jgi:para-nitrobenzyl esterase